MQQFYENQVKLQNNAPVANENSTPNKENYQIDLDSLAEANSENNNPAEENDEEEVEFSPEQFQNKYDNNAIDQNDYNNLNDNNMNENINNNMNQDINNNNSIPSFMETISKNVNENIIPIAENPQEYLPSKTHFCDYDPAQ